MGGYNGKDQYTKYKNAPKCPVCKNIMRYQYTNIKRWKTMWKCRDCGIQEITNGYPDEEDPSKRSFREKCLFIVVT